MKTNNGVMSTLNTDLIPKCLYIYREKDIYPISYTNMEIYPSWSPPHPTPPNSGAARRGAGWVAWGGVGWGGVGGEPLMGTFPYWT